MTRFRVGIDIGGTFTDIVLVGEDGRVETRKVSSSVDDYSQAIITGLQDLFEADRLSAAAIGEVRHGTTVGSNAILEHKGGRTGLIGTRGFRDILQIRNLRLPRLYDIAWDKPNPLVERRLRQTVDERIAANGRVLTQLSVAEAERAVKALLAEGVETIAICLINAYANDAHERILKDAVERLAPSIACSASYEVLPEIGEYERTSTTVINAYVLPVIKTYLGHLRRDLAGIGVKAPLRLMQSNGGLTTSELAERFPMNIIESGPAAGVVGARDVAARIGLKNVITFDMGGTTAKASLIEGGEFSRSQDYQVGGGIINGSRLLTGAGYLLKVPAIDLAEVGAGGGSIIAIDGGGAMQVGPHSAASKPGPVAYDLGGTEPTVTDAVLTLGYLNPDYLVNGALKLNGALARRVLEEKIAKPLGTSLERAAYGAYQIAISRMMRAIRAVSIERGRDPRDYALLAFGGNGPVFAAAMARELRIRTVIIPPLPGLFSAFGLLQGEIEHHFARTCRRALGALTPGELQALLTSVEAEARDRLIEEGFPAASIEVRRTATLRYQGQSFELPVAVPDDVPEKSMVSTLAEAFGREHEKTYGHRAGPDEPVELSALQAIAKGRRADGPAQADPVFDADQAGAKPRMRRAFFGPETGWRDTPVLVRTDLATPRQGPCIVEEYSATCVVPPDATARLDHHGNIVIELL